MTRRAGGRVVLSVAVVVAVVAVGGMLTGALGVSGGASTMGGPVPAVVAPSLAGLTLDGERVDLAELRGDVVVVTIWASWCAPCRTDLPILGALRDARGAQGVHVLGILTRDAPAAGRAMLARTAVDLPSVADPAGRLARAWGAVGVPETFLVGRDGTVRARAAGALTADWLDAEVARLLGEPA